MSNYQIVYNSVMLAMDKQEVTEAFSRLFKLPPEKAAAILNRPKTVLRSNLDSATAEMYREKLMAIGLDVDVLDASMQKPAVLSASQTISLSQQSAPLEVVPIEEKTTEDVPPVQGYQGNRSFPFIFYGTGAEYFRIWIVNIFLTIMTFGIYSAWAKVRTQQYFYGNASLMGASFQYLATPMQVLRGRIIGIILLGLYFSLQYYSATAALVGLVIFIVAAPALIVIAFSARMRFSAWRNVRFDFVRSFGAAYGALKIPAIFFIILYIFMYFAGLIGPDVDKKNIDESLLIPLGGLFVVALFFYPYVDFIVNKLIVANTKFGNEFFGFPATTGGYYAAYGMAFLVFMLCMIPAAFVMGAGAVGLKSANVPEAAYSVLVFASMLLAYVFPFAYLMARRFNLRYNGLVLGKSILLCDVRTRPLVSLYVSNTLAIIFSVGLLIPWAKVRMVEYRLSCLTLHASYELNDIVNDARQSNAVGQEVSDLFDIDIAL